ncbi:DUF4397 domain-containing protein [Bacillus xiapuensis]|uniref:DUF4397 domain-containing protein n=1 Tax=Bacillus xiapuensis TaxID=2014075 RepID=A0ABU6NC59_9BACI|nr:DUF4397 domain-containing protein [Bacillus xiapuensis]
MSENRTHSDYLQRAAMYDTLSQFYKYSSPDLHMQFYLKHMKYINKAFNIMRIHSQHMQAESKIRILNTSPDAPNLDIYINGKRVVRDLSFKEAAQALTIRPGKYHVDIYPAGNMVDSVLNKKITIEPGKSYTWAVIDPSKKMRLLVYLNQPEVPMNEAKIRFIHLSPDTHALDVAVKDRDVIFPKVAYKQATEYLALSPMTVDLEAREAGTKNVILPMPHSHFKANEVYTVFFVGLSTGNPELQSIIIKE